MVRRDFCKSSLVAAVAGLFDRKTIKSFASPAILQKSPATAPVTAYVSEFVVNTRYEDIPEDVLALGKKSILDGFGLALAGSASGVGKLAQQYLEMQGLCADKASVIGTKIKVAPRFAALANGISIHADDYDDTATIPGDAVHATVPVLPPVFAFSEVAGRTGKDLMLAYHVGVEVECKIAEAISPRHYSDGFHATGTMGTFGSAAACAKLLGLNLSQTGYSLGIAAAEAGGLRANFGTMTKPFQAGHAAENGTIAAELASIGWTASPNILEASKGYFQAAGGGFEAGQIMNRLGKPWTFVSPGILIKRFPCGTIQQPIMDAMLRLIQQNKILAPEVAKVNVGASQLEFDNLHHHLPTTGLEGKFSMEFCLSILLVTGKAGLGEFTDSVVNRPEIQEMIRRVNFYVDPQIEESASRILKIEMKDGKVFSDRTGFAKGSPRNPMTFEEVADKFRGCAQFAAWSAEKTESIIIIVRSLESTLDVGRLSKELTI
jgi:2-methylcitrate dehydratase PrpD